MSLLTFAIWAIAPRSASDIIFYGMLVVRINLIPRPPPPHLPQRLHMVTEWFGASDLCSDGQVVTMWVWILAETNGACVLDKPVKPTALDHHQFSTFVLSFTFSLLSVKNVTQVRDSSPRHTSVAIHCQRTWLSQQRALDLVEWWKAWSVDRVVLPWLCRHHPEWSDPMYSPPVGTEKCQGLTYLQLFDNKINMFLINWQMFSDQCIHIHMWLQ